MTNPFQLDGSKVTRRVPVVTAILMAAAVLSAAVLLVLGLVDGDVHGVAPLLVPPVLGMIGAGAAMLTRSLDLGVRVMWMLGSGMVGFAAIWLVYVMLIVVGGP